MMGIASPKLAKALHTCAQSNLLELQLSFVLTLKKPSLTYDIYQSEPISLVMRLTKKFWASLIVHLCFSYESAI